MVMFRLTDIDRRGGGAVVSCSAACCAPAAQAGKGVCLTGGLYVTGALILTLRVCLGGTVLSRTGGTSTPDMRAIASHTPWKYA